MMMITLCMNPKKAVKQARLTPLCRTSVFIQGQKHLMRKGTVFLIPLTQITLDTRSLIRMWTWMTTEITNNANDVYKHLPFCRQAVSWDQSDFFSAPGWEEVCTTSKRPLCLTWLSHVGLDCLNLISFCVTVQMEPR